MKNAQTTLWIVLIVIILVILGGVAFYMNMKPTNANQKIVSTSNPSSTSVKSTTPTDSPSTTSPKETSETYNIDIKNFAFTLSILTIKQGDKVIWTNQDSAPHTVTSDSGNELDSELFGKEEIYSHTFNTAGTFDYHCKPHPYMKARIIVE